MPSLPVPQIPRFARDFSSGLQTPAMQLKMERETGIEPATNSLEGCDSTTELLPHSYCCLPRNLAWGLGPGLKRAPGDSIWKAVTLLPSYSPALPRSRLPAALPRQKPPIRFPSRFLEPMTRIELVTSPLPRECSTN